MRKNIFLILILAIAIGIRLWFVLYTNYTAEDAYITFQFSRNIERVGEFALNPGQQIYGTTTPLLAIMLAGWLFLSRNIVLGARMVDFIASLGGMIFLYTAIRDKRAAIIALFILAVSSKLYVEEMQGMEMPLLFLFASASLYGFSRQKPYLAGIMAGMMLWTRVDAVIWVGCMSVIYFVSNPRHGFQYFVTAVTIYSPWVVFSWIYFGSPIPFTIIAKQVAYGIGNPPYPVHLQRIADYISWPILIGVALSLPALRKERLYWILPLFVIVEISQLTFTGATFFLRYFYLLALMCYVILAIGISDSIENIIMHKVEQKRYLLPIVLLFIYSLSVPGITDSMKYKSLQNVRQNILMQMGMWFNINTPLGTTVLLEPLGYVGWYADRTMIDQVGLVTPRVVELQRYHVPTAAFYQAFWPNYVIWTCGEGGKWREEISKYYKIAKIFDGHKSRACYEVWQRQ